MSDVPVPTESPNCVLCGGETFSLVLARVRDNIWHKPGTFSLERCEGCGLVMTRPRPTESGLDFYYADTYSGEAKAGMKTFQTKSWLGRLLTLYRLQVLAKVWRLGKDDRLLDVGCSYGGFLRAAREYSGCKTWGIDLDEESIAEAVDKEITDYRAGRLEAQDYGDGAFTVITFFECLEHTRFPVETLQHAYRLLAPGGVCVVEVPNFGGFWRMVFRSSWLPLLIPQHLIHFTPETLRATVEAAGFEQVEHQQTMFVPLEGVASFAIAVTRVLRMPPRGAKFSWRTPFDAVVALALLLVVAVGYVAVEIPTQAVLALLGRSGHQTIIARRKTRPPGGSLGGGCQSPE